MSKTKREQRKSRPPEAGDKSMGVFPGLETYLKLRLAVRSDRLPLSSTVYFDPASGKVAVQVEADKVPALRALARQFGNTLSEPGTINGYTETALRDLVGIPLRHVDTGRRAMEEAPDLEEPSCLIGVTDASQSQKILDILQGSTIRGIQVLPVSPTPGESELQWLWKVTGDRPPRAALENCHRSWWGPAVRTQGNEIYFEWPYDHQLASECLEAVDWGENSGLLLFNADGTRTHVTLSEHQPDLASIIEVGHVEAKLLPIAVQETAPAEPTFRIDLRLVSDRRGPTNLDRIASLEGEIAARRTLIQRIEENEGGVDEYISPVFEPMYFYQSPESIPRDIERLLIECCDQNSLRSLQYTRLPGSAFPAGGRLDSSRPVHIVATDSALRSKSTRGGNYWLKDYRPRGGLAMRLLNEWADPYGLRIFVPDGAERLELYPEIRPGEIAAKRLGEGLLGADRVSDHVVLLLPCGARDLSVLPLKREHFRPLVEALPWSCSVERAAGSVEPERVRETAREVLLESVTRSLEEDVSRAAVEAVNTKRNDLEARLLQQAEQLKSDAARQHEAVEKLRGRVREASARVDESRKAVDLEETESTELRESAKRTRRALESLQRSSRRILTQIDEIDRLEEAIRRLERDA